MISTKKVTGRSGRLLKDRWILLILLLATLFSLYGLGDIPFYQDEPLQVLQVQQIDEVGYPRNLLPDGSQIVRVTNKETGEWMELPSHEVLVGLLPHYVEYGFGKLFGFSRWSMRLPSVLLFIISLILVVLFAQERGLGKDVIILSLVFLALNVQLLIFARSARYYMFGLCLVLLSFWLFERYLGKPGWGRLSMLAIPIVLLPQVHILYLSGALGIMGILSIKKWRESKISPHHLAYLAGIALIGVIPYLVFSYPFARMNQAGIGAMAFANNLVLGLSIWHVLLLPWTLLILLLPRRSALKPYLIASLVVVLVLSLLAPLYPRYSLWLLPLLVLALSQGILQQRKKAVRALLVGLILLTNLFMVWPVALLQPASKVVPMDTEAITTNLVGDQGPIRFFLFDYARGLFVLNNDPSEYLTSQRPITEDDVVYGDFWPTLAAEHGSSWEQRFISAAPEDGWWGGITLAVFFEVPPELLGNKDYALKKSIDETLMAQLEASGEFLRSTSEPSFIFAPMGDNTLYVADHIFVQQPQTRIIWYDRII